MSTITELQRPLAIRPATEGDRLALTRLAGRDSTTVPAGDLLVAEVGGEIHAAIAVATGEAIADPFQSTAGAGRPASRCAPSRRRRAAGRCAWSRARTRDPRTEAAATAD